MRRIVFAIAMAATFVTPAAADDFRCKGLLYHLFGIDDGLSCEQRRAMMQLGQQMLNMSAPPPTQIQSSCPPGYIPGMDGYGNTVCCPMGTHVEINAYGNAVCVRP